MVLKIKLTAQEQKMAIAGLICLASLSYLYVAFFWLPITHKKSDTQSKISILDAKIASATRQAEKMPHLKTQIADLEKQAAQLSKQLPSRKGVGDILVTLSKLAERYDISILNFSPGNKVIKPYFIELQYPIVIEGQFHNIGKFFAALSLGERILNIQGVSFGAANPETGIMQVSLTLLAYQYKT
jgi:type IV pilus assembly protein PilO